MQLLDHYLEAGGNVIDTAGVYAAWVPGGAHQSEQVIGEWLRERGTRDQVVLSTKGAHPKLESMDIPRLSKARFKQISTRASNVSVSNMSISIGSTGIRRAIRWKKSSSRWKNFAKPGKSNTLDFRTGGNHGRRKPVWLRSVSA